MCIPDELPIRNLVAYEYLWLSQAGKRENDEAPMLIGDPAEDAWIGAVGEHLAIRWGLREPDRTGRLYTICCLFPVFLPR